MPHFWLLFLLICTSCSHELSPVQVVGPDKQDDSLRIISIFDDSLYEGELLSVQLDTSDLLLNDLSMFIGSVPLVVEGVQGEYVYTTIPPAGSSGRLRIYYQDRAFASTPPIHINRLDSNLCGFTPANPFPDDTLEICFKALPKRPERCTLTLSGKPLEFIDVKGNSLRYVLPIDAKDGMLSIQYASQIVSLDWLSIRSITTRFLYENTISYVGVTLQSHWDKYVTYACRLNYDSAFTVFSSALVFGIEPKTKLNVSRGDSLRASYLRSSRRNSYLRLALKPDDHEQTVSGAIEIVNGTGASMQSGYVAFGPMRWWRDSFGNYVIERLGVTPVLDSLFFYADTWDLQDRIKSSTKLESIDHQGNGELIITISP